MNPILQLPPIPESSHLPSMAYRLATHKDWEGVLQAIRLNQWKGWDELLVPSILDYLFSTGSHQTEPMLFPAHPWPISSEESWPDDSETCSAQIHLCALLIAQNVLSNEQRLAVRRKAQHDLCAPLMEQLFRQQQRDHPDVPFQHSVWCEKFKEKSQWSAASGWVGWTISKDNPLLFHQTLQRMPQLVPLMEQMMKLSHFKNPKLVEIALNAGFRPSVESLEPSNLSEWRYYPQMQNLLPKIVWLHTDGTDEEKLRLSKVWFYENVSSHYFKAANGWLHLIKSLNPDFTPDWSKVLYCFSSGARHDDRVHLSEMINTWTKDEHPDDRKAIVFFAWILMGGQETEKPGHGLERYRWPLLKNLPECVHLAHDWLDANESLGQTPRDNPPTLPLHLLNFDWTPKGQEIMLDQSPLEERRRLSIVIKDVWSSSGYTSAPLFKAVMSYFETDKDLTISNWTSRHQHHAFSFWLNIFSKSEIIMPERPLDEKALVFLTSLLRAGSPWSLDLDTKWVDRLSKRISNQKPEVFEEWIALSTRAKLNQSLDSPPPVLSNPKSKKIRM